MADIVDQCSQGQRFECPFDYCDAAFEALDPQVALAIRNAHIRRKHAD